MFSKFMLLPFKNEMLKLCWSILNNNYKNFVKVITFLKLKKKLLFTK